jgi:hypothetical protein
MASVIPYMYNGTIEKKSSIVVFVSYIRMELARDSKHLFYRNVIKCTENREKSLFNGCSPLVENKAFIPSRIPFN